MGMFTLLEFGTMDDLLLLQLQDLYDAENRLLDALPMMAKAARSPQLAETFRRHYDQTETHMERLEQIFGRLGEKPERQLSTAMRGLISDGEQIINARGNASVRDAALIAAARRVEHYEMAAYGTAAAFAGQLGMGDIARVLEQNLQDEVQADRSLSRIAGETGPRKSTRKARGPKPAKRRQRKTKAS